MTVFVAMWQISRVVLVIRRLIVISVSKTVDDDCLGFAVFGSSSVKVIHGVRTIHTEKPRRNKSFNHALPLTLLSKYTTTPIQ